MAETPEEVFDFTDHSPQRSPQHGQKAPKLPSGRFGVHVRKTATSKDASTQRMCMIWVVFNQCMEAIADFPYAEKARAEAFAEFTQQHCKKGDKYFIQPHKVPMEDE